MPLMKPTVHLNGTSKQALLDETMEAMEAVRRAMETLAKACPNGRDYYPQGPDAIYEALRQHNERIKALHTIRVDLMEIAEHISDQGDGR